MFAMNVMKGLVVGTWLLCLYLLASEAESTSSIPQRLKIASFNMRVFGLNKMKKEEVAQALTQTLAQYDICLVMEIRDSTETAIYQLLGRLNNFRNGDVFDVVTSARLGRTNSKEQYAFIYRKAAVNVIGQYVYADAEDVFEREPFIVTFGSQMTAVAKFALVGIHTKPTDAMREMNELVKVYDDAAERLEIEDIVIMGDFNADCDYVTPLDLEQSVLFTDRRFQWLLSSCADTTTSNDTDCTYDRLVVGGGKMQKAVVPRSARVDDIGATLGLSQEQLEAVSDHYPVYFELKRPVNPNLSSRVGFTIAYTDEIPRKNILAVLEDVQKSKIYFVTYLYDADSECVFLSVTAKDVEDPVQLLTNLWSQYPGCLHSAAIEQVDQNLRVSLASVLSSTDGSTDKYSVSVTYDLKNVNGPVVYEIEVNKQL